jgi:hypothetical protein
LKHDFFDGYIAGTKTDADFRKEHLLDPQHVIADGRLYCAITVDESQLKTDYERDFTKSVREIRDHLLRETVRAIKEGYFSQAGVKGTLSVYAIEASGPGKGLLLQIGIRKISAGTKRKDKKPLYRLELNRDDVDARLAMTLNPPARPTRSSRANPRDVKVRRSGKR